MNNFLKSLFFVRKCVVCDRVMPDADADTVFCEDCEREYKRLCRDICPNCEKAERECRCVPRKLKGKVEFSSHLFLFHDDISRKIVYSFKMKRNPYLQRFMARELSERILEVTGGDCSDFTVTFVPRKPRSIRIYGFDQSRILATLVAQRLDLPFGEIFCHTRFSKLQKRLSVREREKNAQKSYLLRDDFVRQTDKLMILDDVMTTGSTLDALIFLAQAAGFREIAVVCIAKTGRT